MIFTARQVVHYWNGDSKARPHVFKTESLLAYSSWITQSVKYWEGELKYGPLDDIQSVTIETSSGMPDVGIARDYDGSVEVTELNVSY
jgi:hypothetical protein